MSTPQPPATPGPDQIEQVIKEVKTAPQGGGMPLEVTLPTGEVYKGTTPQELLDRVVAGKVEANNHLRQQKEENRRLQEQLAAAVAPKPSESEAATARKIQERYATWAQNPTEATRQDLAELLDVPADRVIDVLRRAITQSTAGGASEEFMARYPEFPNTKESAMAMNAKLRQKFGAGLDAATADNLELAYNELRREGVITPNMMQPSGFSQQNAALPNLRGSSAPANPVNDSLQNFSNMSLDQMKTTIERLAQMMGNKS